MYMNPDWSIVVAGEKLMSICPDLPPIVLLDEVTVNLSAVVTDENKNVLPDPSGCDDVATQPTL